MWDIIALLLAAAAAASYCTYRDVTWTAICPPQAPRAVQRSRNLDRLVRLNRAATVTAKEEGPMVVLQARVAAAFPWVLVKAA